MPGCRLLLVEGDSQSRDQAAYVLVSLSYSFTAVETGSAAIEMLQSPDAKYDAVLVAIRLPDMNGVEFLQRVPQLPRSVPVILMLEFGWDQGPLIAKARAAGLSREGIVYKPLRAVQLRACLEKLLGKQGNED